MVYNAKSVYNAKGVYNGETVYNGGGSPVPSTVIVGGIEYGVIELNGLLWITENLRNVTAHSKNSSPDTPFNGKLYNYPYLYEIENLLSDGWRIPTHNDYLTWGSLSQNAKDYISTSLNGNDIYGLNFPLPGIINSGGNRQYKDSSCILWTKTPAPIQDSFYTVDINKADDRIYLSDTKKGQNTYVLIALSVRICKDV